MAKQLHSVRTEFIDSVSDAVLSQLLDRLLQKGMLTQEEVEIANGTRRADKARYVVDTVIKKGSKVSLFLIENYCKLDPHSDLCRKLTHP
uniref:CARD domain-containing protein n=1 Tax=Neogobius melanostomus TaxID=47308 RepID=A0A8C6WIR4_9GOBI